MKTLKKSLIITALGASIFAGNAFAEDNQKEFNETQWIKDTKNHMSDMSLTEVKSYIEGMDVKKICEEFQESGAKGTTQVACRRAVKSLQNSAPVLLGLLEQAEKTIADSKNKEANSNSCGQFCPKPETTAAANCTSKDEQIANLTLENKRLNGTFSELSYETTSQKKTISGLKKNIAVAKLNEKIKNTRAGTLNCSGEIKFSLNDEVAKLKVIDLVNSENDFEAFVAQASGMSIILGLNKQDPVYIFNDAEAAEILNGVTDPVQEVKWFSVALNDKVYILCLDIDNIDIANLTGNETIPAVLVTVDQTVGCLSAPVNESFFKAIENVILDHRAAKQKASVGASNNTVTCKEVCNKTRHGLICSEVCN